MLHAHRGELTVASQRLLPRRLLRKVDVEDVVQEVFERACKDQERFTGRIDAEVRAYLIQTLQWVIEDLIRRYGRGKRSVLRERPFEPVPGDSAKGFEEWLAADHTSPTQKARRNEQLRRLDAALSHLPDDQREAVELHYFKGLSLKETAVSMGKSTQAVAGLRRRGLKAMRTRLGNRAD